VVSHQSNSWPVSEGGRGTYTCQRYVQYVANKSTSTGVVVQQWSDNGGTNQQWSLVATS
jgi:hypothetical protein